MQCFVKKKNTIIKQNVTYNQYKRPQEFCEEFLEYSMFESTVLPHAFLVLYFHVSLCQLLLKLQDVQPSEPLELIKALASNLHLYPTAAIQHSSLIHVNNHHPPVVSLTNTQSVPAEDRQSIDRCCISIKRKFKSDFLTYLCV